MSNILDEEIHIIKKLFHTKGGFLLSEQYSNEQLIGQKIVDATTGQMGTDENALVNAVLSIKDKAAFFNINSWMKSNSRYKQDFFQQVGGDLESDDLDTVQKIVDHLNKINVNTSFEKTQSGGYKPYSLKYTGTSNAMPATEESWKTTNSCVPSQNGATPVKLNDGSTAYKIGEIYYYSNGRKKLADGTMANYSCDKEFKTNKGNNPRQANKGNNSGQNVSQRFAKSASSLGIQNGKMDIQSLQAILAQLNGTQPGSPTGGQQPDLAQLTNVLNQLSSKP